MTRELGTRLCQLGVCTLASLALGCAQPEPSDPETEAHAQKIEASLIERIHVGSAVVSYYEPEPGALIEAEIGDVGEGALPGTENLTFTQRFELLTGEPAPRVLAEAQARADGSLVPYLNPDGTGVPGLEDTTGGLGGDEVVIGSDMTEELFISRFCVPQDRFWGGTRRTDDSFFEASGVNYMKTGAYVYRGEVNYRVTYTGAGSGSLGMTFPLTVGRYGGFRHKSTLNRSVSSKVSAAEGDGYHHCVNYHF